MLQRPRCLGTAHKNCRFGMISTPLASLAHPVNLERDSISLRIHSLRPNDRRPCHRSRGERRPQLWRRCRRSGHGIHSGKQVSQRSLSGSLLCVLTEKNKKWRGCRTDCSMPECRIMSCHIMLPHPVACVQSNFEEEEMNHTRKAPAYKKTGFSLPKIFKKE
jgi:hypothetical protein